MLERIGGLKILTSGLSCVRPSRKIDFVWDYNFLLFAAFFWLLSLLILSCFLLHICKTMNRSLLFVINASLLYAYTAFLMLDRLFIISPLTKGKQPQCFSTSITFVLLMNGPGLERLWDIANHQGQFQASLSISHYLKSRPYTVCLVLNKLSYSVLSSPEADMELLLSPKVLTQEWSIRFRIIIGSRICRSCSIFLFYLFLSGSQ